MARASAIRRYGHAGSGPVKTAWLVLGGLAALLAGVQLYLRRVWFFRDPVRVPPDEPGIIVAPADGKVIYIRPVEKGLIFAEKLGEAIPLEEITKAQSDWGGEGWIVGIYMSPLDVHFNYAPVAGRVERIAYTGARANLPMVDLWEYVRLTYLRRAVDLFGHRYHLVNERNTVFIDGGDIRLAAVEIADKFVNKIDCYIRPGDTLRRGQKISFIKRGSQVDLVIFRRDVEFLVKVGQQVYGARTAIARYRTPTDRGYAVDDENRPAGGSGADGGRES